MTRLAQAVFGLLVCATVGSLFVAQRLKSQDPPVRALSKTTDRLFSPNGDGRNDQARISFRLKKRSDTVTVDLVDADGDVVRRLVDDRFLRAGPELTFRWDGRGDAGRPAPDAVYRPRVKLRRQGRTIVLPVEIALDRTPPRPVVTVLGFGERAGPAVVAAGGTAPVDFRFTAGDAGSGPPRFQVYRTDVVPPRVVASFPGRAGDDTGRWEGRVNGRPAAPGTYLIVARVRDRAGNVGAVPQNLRSGSPLRGPLPGRAGVTVRSLGVQAPGEPVVAGELARLFVDARGKPYRWELRRLGRARVIDRGRGSGPALRLRTPFGRSGAYLVRVRAAGRTVSAPLIVQAARASKVLVVLPTITWQGRNPVDDEGDGVPNTLESGEPVGTSRLYARGLPAGFRRGEGALLEFLDRARERYDLTTDLALVRGNGPTLVRDRPGVLIAGDARWLPPTVDAALRGYVQRGGRLLSLGTDSLRRSVRVRGTRLTEPSPAAPADAFGARLRPLRRERSRLLAFPGDTIELWEGSDGLIRGFDEVEETASVGPGTRLAAGGGTREDRPVIAAVRVGRGVVIRTGLPQWSAMLDSNRGANQLMAQMWKILEAPR